MAFNFPSFISRVSNRGIGGFGSLAGSGSSRVFESSSFVSFSSSSSSVHHTKEAQEGVLSSITSGGISSSSSSSSSHLKDSSSSLFPWILNGSRGEKSSGRGVDSNWEKSGFAGSALNQVRDEDRDRLVEREKTMLEGLRMQLDALDASKSDMERLDRSLRDLEDMFLLVIVGEFNSGKSSLLNALLGTRFLPEGVTPTTAKLNMIKFGDPSSNPDALASTGGASETINLYYQIPWLKDINLVDTPGTNAINENHQRLTEHFVPRSDLVLFVTSSDRPFSASEQAFMKSIRDWGKKVVVVLNKIDLFKSDEERETALDFVEENTARLLNTTPQLFAVSAARALEARGNRDAQEAEIEWSRSGFADLESFILSSLDGSERLRLKLKTPLGVAEHMGEKYKGVIDAHRALIKGDLDTLVAIDEQLAAFLSDMDQDFAFQLSRVNTVLSDMESRADKFFDEKLRLTNVFGLLNTSNIQKEFAADVVSDSQRLLDAHTAELVDWVVERTYKQWRAVMDFLGKRSASPGAQANVVGTVDPGFEFNRQALLTNISATASKIMASYDKDREAARTADRLQSAVFQSAAIQVGALGLGTATLAMFETALMDAAGLAGAGMLAAMGLYVLPARRRAVKAEMNERVGEVRAKLEVALRKHFTESMDVHRQKVKEAIAPYERFVRVQQDKLNKIDSNLDKTLATVEDLRQDIERTLHR